MSTPIVRATTCPGLAELKASWALIRSGADLYLGRLTNEDGPDGLARVDDPFEYHEAREVVNGPHGATLRTQRKCFPLHSLPIESTALRIDEVTLFDRMPDAVLEVIRSVLIEAWEAREHIRKVASGSRVTLVSGGGQ